jgi:hypothetical protein
MIRLGDELALVKTSPVAVSIAETYEGVYKTLERYRENCAHNAAYEMECKDGHASKRNRWLTDVLGKVTPVVGAFSSSDLPTYLVVGGKRIPLVVDEVKTVEVGGPDGYELELHVKEVEDGEDG